MRLGIVASPDEDAALDEAVRAAAAADVAVIVAGSAETTESEGFDRETLRLPGRQDELIERVSAANPRTVVVVNAGMPVLMPWAGQVAAVLYAWLPGQAMGEALADILLGRAEPGGRLPVTMPVREADCPVLRAEPAGRAARLRRGPARRVPGLRRGRDRAAVPVRSWAGLHQLGLRVADGRSPRPGRRGRPHDRGHGAQHRRAPRARGGAGVRGRSRGDGRPVRVLGAFASAAAAPGETAQVTLTHPGPGVRPLRRAGGPVDLAARRVHHHGRPVLAGPPAEHRGGRRPDRRAPPDAASPGGPGGPPDLGGARSVPPRSASPGRRTAAQLIQPAAGSSGPGG